MKRIIILGDGMADEPLQELGGRTPLQVAHTPNMDYLAQQGRCGSLHTVPEGFKPGSEIANLALLGYDVAKVFEGRGSLEAASMGVEIEPNEVAARCNLITVENGKILNHSAGHITTEEADELMQFLQSELGNESVRFFTGISYRHLLKIKGADKRVECTPPHDVPGANCSDVMPQAMCAEAEQSAQLISELIVKSQQILPSHPINIKRVAEGKAPANSIWPWSLGYRPAMPTLAQSYGVKSGSVISAVDLIKGIGIYAGLDSIDVEGATGLYNTNYEGKAQAAIEALREQEFVFLHVEASDEAGHEGDYDLKIKTIEYLDSRIIAPILKEVSTWSEPVTIALLPDHPTPCALRTHTCGAVPFVIYNPQAEPDKVEKYDEFTVTEGVYGELQGDMFMSALFEKY